MARFKDETSRISADWLMLTFQEMLRISSMTTHAGSGSACTSNDGLGNENAMAAAANPAAAEPR